MTKPKLTEEQQAAQDSIHDLVNDAIGAISQIRYGILGEIEKDKLMKEVQGNLIDIDTLRRNC